MHLQVKPAGDGHVVISAPLSVDDKAIEAYARTQLGFIKRAIAQFQDQPRASKRQYVSGETMYIWGKQYFLVFKPDNQKNSFEIQNQNIVLSMSAKNTVKQRDAYVKEEYRKILKEEIEKRLPKWETQTGLKVILGKRNIWSQNGVPAAQIKRSCGSTCSSPRNRMPALIILFCMSLHI